MSQAMEVLLTTFLNFLMAVEIDKLILWLPTDASLVTFLLVTLRQGVCLVHGVIVHQSAQVRL